ncbi:MAG TPA: fused MFS/spermidine synthase [Candidatus Eisenbacteria bacterium]|nr:fused MFS/spermidine synthase [Candidatus Eisenbacteria bacterium]
MTAVLWACFVVSGAAALALEMLWMRSASLVFGGTAATAASVLACYFVGLAAGALLASRGSARPVRRYGALELGAAAGAAWSVVAFALLGGEDAQAALAGAGPLAQLGAAACAILPATMCLGATLPTLGHALARDAVGRRGGLLYALNTLGAAAGAAAAGFGLPAFVGVRASYAIAILCGAGAGAAALVVGDRTTRCAPDARPPARDPLPARLVLVAAATGALGLGLEVLWTRIFAQVLHNSVYSFTTVALVFLVAIAAGAALAGLLLARVPAERIAATALVVAGVGTVGGYWLFVWLTDGLAYVGMKAGLAEYVGRIVALAAATAGPAALAGAAVLPALWEEFGITRGPARPMGLLTAASCLGGAAGALVAGFVVVPALGVRGGLLLAAVGYVVLADVASPARGTWRLLAYAGLLAVIVADPLRAPLTHLRNSVETIRATLEGPSGIATVVDSGVDTQLRLDSFYTLGGSASAANERRQGLVPLLLHPDPHRVAFIGLATGITASAAPALGVRETTVIEVVPEVATLARTHFGVWNDGLLERDGVRLVVGDGRRHLAASDERFDVVVSDLFIPWHAGAGSLYAREMYETAARRLAPGGLFCQWLPLYQLTREELDVIARTFLAVFPHVTLWRDDFYADRPVVALVGLLEPRTLDLEQVGERIAALPEAARDTVVQSPRGLAMLYAGDLTAAADLFTAAPLNTDDRPVIEFLAPRLTRMSSAGDKDWFTGEALEAFYASLADQPPALLPPTDDTGRGRRAGLALFRYALASARHDDQAAARHQADVQRLVPEVVAAADRSPAVDPDDAFARLRREESQLRRQVSEMERRLADLAGGDE